MKVNRFKVVDLFSGCGGMSYGFHKHSSFEILAAADAELGKPSSPAGALRCNSTYEANIGVAPKRINLAKVQPGSLRGSLGLDAAGKSVSFWSVHPAPGFPEPTPITICPMTTGTIWSRKPLILSKKFLRISSSWRTPVRF